jgi:hypothetical protein
MAIDERNVSAGAVDAPTDERAPTTLDDATLDDLRRRLDSPLFARDPGLASAPQVPGLRELTWEHVINPTSQQPVVASTPAPELTPVPKAAPVSIEALLSQPEPTPVDDGDTVSVAPATPPPVPSFSDIAAGSAVGSPAVGNEWTDAPSNGSSNGPSIDDAMLQITDRPPVAREEDPVVAGLAALIAQHTPASGQPAVAVAPAVEPAPEPLMELVLEPVVEPAAAVTAPATDAVTVTAAPPPPPPALVPPAPITSQHSISAIEAELNRLAFVPDHEDLGPVEVPQIVSSTESTIAPSVHLTGSTITLPASAAPAPSLSAAPLFTPRQAMAPQHVGRTYADLVAETTPVRTKPKKHTGLKLVAAIVLLAMLAGGLFAAKYYLLDRTHWSAEMAPLAKEVENARGLTFDRDVPLVTVAPAEYATRLGDSLLGFTEENAPAIQAEWRSLGLLDGPLDRAAIGASAMADSPAFYDAATGHIYEVSGLGADFRRFSIERALTMALLDQHFAWSNHITGESQSVQIGTRALFDADAMATATSLIPTSSKSRIATQMFQMYKQYKIPPTPSPFATTVAGRLGLADRPFFDELDPKDRDLLEQKGVFPDGQVFDLRRLTAKDLETARANSRGMLYWYHVLAARLDDDLAWRVALTWQADTLTTVDSGATTCVAAVFTPSPAGAAAALLTFQAWAKAAPHNSLTKVTSLPGTGGAKQIKIDACDPGKSVHTNDGKPRLSLGGAPLRAEQYHQLMYAERQLLPAQVACAVYGKDKVTLTDERLVVDLPSGWKALGQHPTPNPLGAGCAATSP